MSARVEVTSRELRQGIEAALATNIAARLEVTESYRRVKDGEEGFSASSAILLAAASKLHSEGFTEAEIMSVFQRGLDELGVPVG